ncbi:MAG: T9SS type A sorting domain-containing protein [Saprospiraceae bacterium]
MRFNRLILALIWASAFTPCSVSATSIIPFANLGEASLYSECVVLARAVESVETTENGTTFMDTKFESIECTKGILYPGTKFSLRPFSRFVGDHKIDIAGDFKPETGKTYLLFLSRKESFWRPVMLSYYVFEQFQEGDDAFLVPIEADGIEVLTRPDGQFVEPLRVFRQELLLQQLRAIAGSPQMVWDGSIGRSMLQRDDFKAQDRAVPVGCDFAFGGSLCRWENAALPVYYDNTGNPANWGARFGNVLAALNTNYVGIDPSNGGSENYVPDCDGGSAVGGNFIDFCDNNLNGEQSALIIFDDPCDEIPDLNNCSGTLAFGGSYSSANTHQFDGQDWQNAIYGFVVVNNGTPSCLTDIQFEQMMSHELTHVYRMGHLDNNDFPNQNMNPFCCNAINFKDRECMDYAYPGPAPVELLSFEARLYSEHQVKLKWITSSEKDNAFFSVKRSANGIQYESIQQVASLQNIAGGSYEWIDTRPLAGVNYYMLSQTDFDGSVKHLGIKALTVGRKDDLLDISPNPIKEGVLIFNLNFPTDFEGKLEVLDTDSRAVLSSAVSFEKGMQGLQQPLGEIPSGVYLLYLYDEQHRWSTRFLKQ